MSTQITYYIWKQETNFYPLTKTNIEKQEQHLLTKVSEISE